MGRHDGGTCLPTPYTASCTHLTSSCVFSLVILYFDIALFALRTIPPHSNMDQRIFDQLDMLARDARVETRRESGMYGNSNAEYSGYDKLEAVYDESAGFSQGYHEAQDEFADQPMVLDSFGERTSLR